VVYSNNQQINSLKNVSTRLLKLTSKQPTPARLGTLPSPPLRSGAYNARSQNNIGWSSTHSNDRTSGQTANNAHEEKAQQFNERQPTQLTAQHRRTNSIYDSYRPHLGARGPPAVNRLAHTSPSGKAATPRPWYRKLTVTPSSRFRHT